MYNAIDKIEVMGGYRKVAELTGINPSTVFRHVKKTRQPGLFSLGKYNRFGITLQDWLAVYEKISDARLD